METPDPTPSGGRRRRWWLAGLVAAVFLVAYVLSAGPAVGMMQRRALSEEFVTAVYFSPISPLQVMINVVPGFERLMQRYLAHWDPEKPRA